METFEERQAGVPLESAPQRCLAGPSSISFTLSHSTQQPDICTLFPADLRFLELDRFEEVAHPADFCLSHGPFAVGRVHHTDPKSVHRSKTYARTPEKSLTLRCSNAWQSPCGWVLHPDENDAAVAHWTGLRPEDRNDETGTRCLDGAA